MSKYVAELSFEGNNVCVVKFPAHLANDIPAETRKYEVLGDLIRVNETKEVKCPLYAARAIILVDINISLQKRGMKVSMLMYNGKEIKSLRRVFVSNLNPNLSKEDINKELDLSIKILSGIKGKEAVDLKEDINHGYDLFLTLLECEGINV